MSRISLFFALIIVTIFLIYFASSAAQLDTPVSPLAAESAEKVVEFLRLVREPVRGEALDGVRHSERKGELEITEVELDKAGSIVIDNRTGRIFDYGAPDWNAPSRDDLASVGPISREPAFDSLRPVLESFGLSLSINDYESVYTENIGCIWQFSYGSKELSEKTHFVAVVAADSGRILTIRYLPPVPIASDNIEITEEQAAALAVEWTKSAPRYATLELVPATSHPLEIRVVRGKHRMMDNRKFEDLITDTEAYRCWVVPFSSLKHPDFGKIGVLVDVTSGEVIDVVLSGL